MEPVEDNRVGGDKGRLVAVAASEVLGGNDRNGISIFGAYQQNLAVIVSEICSLDNLGDERPKFERLVGRLVVEHKVDARHFICFADKEQAAQKLLGNGERSLPDLCNSDLA